MVSILDKASSLLPSAFNDGRKVSDAVIFRVGGKRYDAWEDVTIERHIDAVSGSFQASMRDQWRNEGGPWPLKPGQEINVSIGDTLVLSGYIYRTDVAGDNTDRQITIAGRDKMGDLIDASIIGTTGNVYRDIPLDRLCQKVIAEYPGLSIEVIKEADVGDNFKIASFKKGETGFDFLNRAAKLRGVLLQSTPQGNLLITNRATQSAESKAAQANASNLKAEADFIAGATGLTSSVVQTALNPGTKSPFKSSVDLVQGENILGVTASFDHTDRFSQYIVIGQNRGTDESFGDDVRKVKSATAFDNGLGRFRPKILVAESPVDKAAADLRAGWENVVRAAKSLDLTITVRGWGKPDGTLWLPNQLVFVDCKFAGIEAEMLISAVRYSKGKEGTISELKLTRPDAYAPKLELSADEDPINDLGWGLKTDLKSKVAGLIK